MGIHFTFRDFAFPVEILRLRRSFADHPWWSAEPMERYQLEKLRETLRHAVRHVPYYRRLFAERRLAADDIRTLADLKTLPLLTKFELRSQLSELTAQDARRWRPRLARTSGSTGSSVSFYLDKASNVLEFVHYWRFWGWAGYRLGDRFAELSTEEFLPFERHAETLSRFERAAGRLLLNSFLLSRARRDAWIRTLEDYRPRFLKGLPSNLYVLAMLLGERPKGLALKAVFSQGEQLLSHQRQRIEDVFRCPVLDAYGQMERTAAITQCPSGRYHIHSDYGLVELVEVPGVESPGSESRIVEIIATTLYNRVMPLVRYRTGDYAEVTDGALPCPCGRGFPVVESILGRQSDIVISSDGRAITALYVLLDRVPGILLGEILQDRIDHLSLRIACDPKEKDRIEGELRCQLRRFLGSAVRVDFRYESVDEILRDRPAKFRVVRSQIPWENFVS
jgi:phenylacetate-CoA ligase